jgi:isovaleryl-CoA dehydrogenase
MRGNSARTLFLDKVPVSSRDLLGNEGDEIWYVFHVIAPYFLMAMAGTYLGVAEAALNIAIQHVKHRSFSTGSRLSELTVIQKQLGIMWASVQKLKHLVYSAGNLGDLGAPQALPEILASKAEAAGVAVQITNDAMSICGGAAYAENSRLARLLRDARAAPVMTPTTDMLHEWIGKICLDLPIL